MKKQRHIDLHLPTAWNRCTTEELELIAQAVLDEQHRASRYHPFTWEAVKVRVVMAVNGIVPLGDGSTVNASGYHSDMEPSPVAVKRPQDEEAWELSAEVMLGLCERLEWMTDAKAEPLLRAPYAEFTPLLDGYSWQEYRTMQDYMQLYMQQVNAGRDGREARQQFLSTLTRGEPWTDSDVRWQVVLFWWSGLMRWLQEKYPHCFKAAKPGKRSRRHNPLEIYVSVIATMQGEYKLTEREINEQSFHVVLEQLERLSKQSEEMEKLNRRNRSRK